MEEILSALGKLSKQLESESHFTREQIGLVRLDVKELDANVAELQGATAVFEKSLEEMKSSVEEVSNRVVLVETEIDKTPAADRIKSKTVRAFQARGQLGFSDDEDRHFPSREVRGSTKGRRDSTLFDTGGGGTTSIRGVDERESQVVF